MCANVIMKENVCKCYNERKCMQMLSWKKMCANVILKENVCKCYPERKCVQMLSLKKMCANVIMKKMCANEPKFCQQTTSADNVIFKCLNLIYLSILFL